MPDVRAEIARLQEQRRDRQRFYVLGRLLRGEDVTICTETEAAAREWEAWVKKQVERISRGPAE